MRMSLLSPVALLFVAALWAGFGCGGDTDPSGGGGAGGSGAGGEAANCAAGEVCFNVTPAGTVTAGNLGVIWLRLEADGAHDATVAYTAPFTTDLQLVGVPLAQVTAPPDLDFMCERSCADPATCPACTGDFAAAVAYVMIVVDTNQNSVIDTEELADPNNLVGIANAAIVYSEVAHETAPAPYDATFPDGVSAGTHAYRVGSNTTFLKADDTQRFSLRAGTDAL
ncbi:MAG: hypothetical protein U0271_27875 [Polyangiaceae bacterium]